MSPNDPHSEAADAVHEGRPVDAEYVRGARPGKRILWLLILSGGATAVLLLGMWVLSNSGFAAQNPNNGEEAADVAAFSERTVDPAGPASAGSPLPATN